MSPTSYLTAPPRSNRNVTYSLGQGMSSPKLRKICGSGIVPCPRPQHCYTVLNIQIRKARMKRYVIIGNGVAGNTAAEQILKYDTSRKITIFSEENQPFYYRVRLPEAVAGEVDLDRITIHPESWYEEHGIELLKDNAAGEVDIIGGRIRGADGEIRRFDKLLLAVGARSFIPPVAGSNLPGVYALRTWQDARAIAEQASGSDRAILVGGGLLGLEAGYGLIRRGIKVQVVEFFDRLLPRQMDPAGAAKLQKRLEALGFSFYLGAKAKEISQSAGGLSLALEDGQVLDGGLVLFSAGIRPNLELAVNMGLDTDKGIKVDDHLRTSAPDVYAAGDAIEHHGRLYGIWPAARDQGRVAGINMAGGDTEYNGTIMSNSLKVVGVDLTAAGEIDADGNLDSAVYEDDEIYRKIVAKDGRLAGFIFYGAKDGVAPCTKALEAKAEVGHLMDDMRKKDFDFSRLG